MDIKYINNCLENGIVPDCLNFTLQEREYEIDYNKLNYLDFYDYDYYARRFPAGYTSIAGFDKVIESFVNININNKNTPLNEIEKRRNIKSNIE
jgi:hypothetical protein